MRMDESPQEEPVTRRGREGHGGMGGVWGALEGPGRTGWLTGKGEQLEGSSWHSIFSGKSPSPFCG